MGCRKVSLCSSWDFLNSFRGSLKPENQNPKPLNPKALKKKALNPKP